MIPVESMQATSDLSVMIPKPSLKRKSSLSSLPINSPNAKTVKLALIPEDRETLISSIIFIYRMHDLGGPWFQLMPTLRERALKYLDRDDGAASEEEILSIFKLALLNKEKNEELQAAVREIIYVYSYVESMLKQFQFNEAGEIHSSSKQKLNIQYPELISTLDHLACEITTAGLGRTADTIKNIMYSFTKGYRASKGCAESEEKESGVVVPRLNVRLVIPEALLGGGSFGKVSLVARISLRNTKSFALKEPREYCREAGAFSEEEIKEKRDRSTRYLNREHDIIAHAHKKGYNFIIGPCQGHITKSNSAGEKYSGCLLPLCDGDLQSLLKQDLPLSKRIEIAIAVIDLYEKLRAAELVHGDISLDNILYKKVKGVLNLVFSDVSSMNNRAGTLHNSHGDSTKGAYSDIKSYKQLIEALQKKDRKSWFEARQKRDSFAVLVSIFKLITDLYPFAEHLKEDRQCVDIESGLPVEQLREKGFSEVIPLFREMFDLENPKLPLFFKERIQALPVDRILQEREAAGRKAQRILKLPIPETSVSDLEIDVSPEGDIVN